jgi:hypothetical protein
MEAIDVVASKRMPLGIQQDNVSPRRHLYMAKKKATRKKASRKKATKKAATRKPARRKKAARRR